jgi:hypothetical protein
MKSFSRELARNFAANAFVAPVTNAVFTPGFDFRDLSIVIVT